MQASTRKGFMVIAQMLDPLKELDFNLPFELWETKLHVFILSKKLIARQTQQDTVELVLIIDRHCLLGIQSQLAIATRSMSLIDLERVGWVG